MFGTSNCSSYMNLKEYLFNARELKLSSMDFTNFVVQESVNLVGYRPQVVHSIDESFDGIIFQGLEHSIRVGRIK